MKKLNVIVPIAILIISIITIYLLVSTRDNAFTLDDYENYLRDFKTDIVLGPIKDAKTAKEHAKKIFMETFEQEKANEPYYAWYDKKNKVWLVEEEFCKGCKFDFLNVCGCAGGPATIIIQEQDGKVLALWNWK